MISGLGWFVATVDGSRITRLEPVVAFRFACDGSGSMLPYVSRLRGVAEEVSGPEYRLVQQHAPAIATSKPRGVATVARSERHTVITAYVDLATDNAYEWTLPVGA